jgi:hypothetical protein
VTLELPDRTTDEGLEARVLLAECRSPLYAGYTIEAATECMQLMDLVLWNRVDDPKPYGASQGTLASAVRAPGQFAGFEHYPTYSAGIKANIQAMLNIANSTKDKRSELVAAHIQAALDVASDVTIPDPTPGSLVGWRTFGSGSPGAGFKLYKTVLFNSFYYKST